MLLTSGNPLGIDTPDPNKINKFKIFPLKALNDQVGKVVSITINYLFDSFFLSLSHIRDACFCASEICSFVIKSVIVINTSLDFSEPLAFAILIHE